MGSIWDGLLVGSLVNIKEADDGLLWSEEKEQRFITATISMSCTFKRAQKEQRYIGYRTDNQYVTGLIDKQPSTFSVLNLLIFKFNYHTKLAYLTNKFSMEGICGVWCYQIMLSHWCWSGVNDTFLFKNVRIILDENLNVSLGKHTRTHFPRLIQSVNLLFLSRPAACLCWLNLWHFHHRILCGGQNMGWTAVSECFDSSLLFVMADTHTQSSILTLSKDLLWHLLVFHSLCFIH